MSRLSFGPSIGSAFHPRDFAVALGVSLAVLIAVATLEFGALALLGPAVGGAIIARGRRYVEAGLAGALAAGVGILFEYALAAPGAAFGAGGGAGVALVGHYFGRRVFDR